MARDSKRTVRSQRPDRQAGYAWRAGLLDAGIMLKRADPHGRRIDEEAADRVLERIIRSEFNRDVDADRSPSGCDPPASNRAWAVDPSLP